MSSWWRALAGSLVLTFAIGGVATGAPGKGRGHGPPGLSGLPPGHGGAPPGQTGTPPGHGGSPPGHGNQLRFLAPNDFLSDVGGRVPFVLRVHPRVSVSDLEIEVNGVAVPPSQYQRVRPTWIIGHLSPAAAGPQLVEAWASRRHGPHTTTQHASASFDAIELDRPESCEDLNQVECMYPFPTSRYLEPADTPTGWQVAIPPEATPEVVAGSVQNLLSGVRTKLDPTPINENDGFSPTVQVLMHFPGGVDLEGSGASRLLPDTRSFDLRSLDRSSPSVLIDADTREHIAHFLENDIRATPEYQSGFEDLSPEDLERFLAGQATILRPGKSLTPGHRYIVAVRDLVHEDGSEVEAEAVFAAFRDRRPTNIPSILERRREFEDIFHRLRRAGVPRNDLVLAFDFVVGSDESLTGQMLSMRSQGFDWLAASNGGSSTFSVDEVIVHNPGCQDPDIPVWKEVRGGFQVPLFLASDPFLPDTVGVPARLVTDEAGVPVWTTTTNAPYGIGIPCSAFDAPAAPLIVGHGLFGTGQGMVEAVAGAALAGSDFVVGGTNWSGLSSPDIGAIPSGLDDIAALIEFLQSFIGGTLIDFDKFPAMGDRLRQGQLDTLVLARMLTTGAFNSHPEFKAPTGHGVIEPGEGFYFGVSLGGIMGSMFAALTPDVLNLNVDVPAMNFSIMLQRASPFLPFELLLQILEPDPNLHLVTVGLLHETWVRGEPAGYATHVTRNPFPGTPPKNILLTEAFLDQQVTNIGTQILAATLELPNLVEGSVMRDLPLIPDAKGPLSSAHVVYDTGSFDVTDPADQPFIPPLANLQPVPNGCDPHARRLTIPASLEQLAHFLQPGGRIENFCTGLCDAAEPLEIPGGQDAPCDPANPTNPF
jgi:hypothetical protein